MMRTDGAGHNDPITTPIKDKFRGLYKYYMASNASMMERGGAVK